MKIIYKNWTILIFLLSLIAVSSALIAEIIFNLTPCKMCLYQRNPYYFIIGIILFFYFLKKIESIWLYLFIEIAILYGIFYSAWHVGIEQNIFQGPSGCSLTLNLVSSTKELKDQILNQDIISCSEMSWMVFGLSAATINLILMIFFIYFNTVYVYRKLYGQEKKI
tara:strand:+ start:1414 stop:1911 length:498 start_codon:yes stop_codon:yes gene_type:complete